MSRPPAEPPPAEAARAGAKASRNPEDLAQEHRDRAALRRKAVHLFLVAIAASLVVFTIAGDRGAVTLYRKWQERRALTDQIQALERDNARKRQENDRLESDPRAVEKIAREELDMLRPGEIMFVLPPSPSPAAAAPVAAPAPAP